MLLNRDHLHISVVPEDPSTRNRYLEKIHRNGNVLRSFYRPIYCYIDCPVCYYYSLNFSTKEKHLKISKAKEIIIFNSLVNTCYENDVLLVQ